MRICHLLQHQNRMTAPNQKGKLPEHIKESTTREKVMKNIRHALIEPADNPFDGVNFSQPIFQPLQDTPDVNFAAEFTAAGGKFVFCESPEDMVTKIQQLFSERQWQEAWCNDAPLSAMLRHAGLGTKDSGENLENMKVAVTGCEALVSRTGSVLVSSKQKSGRRMHIYPERHIVIAFTSQVVTDMHQGLELIKRKYNGRMPSSVSLITGPSRTADIEKTLVTGMHGPVELFVFMADDAEDAG